MKNRMTVERFVWASVAVVALGWCAAYGQAPAPAAATSEIGKELRQLEKDVIQPPSPKATPAGDALKMKKEAAKPSVPSGEADGGRPIRKLEIAGDEAILKDATLWDLTVDYIEGRGLGINHLLAVTNEPPRTRAERHQAAPGKIQEAARRIGFPLPASASFVQARRAAEGQTLLALLRREIEGRTLTMIRADEIASRYEAALRDRGYYLASLITLPDRFSEGVVLMEADEGRIGKIRFFADGQRNRPAAERKPYAGRYFSEAQLRRKVQDLGYGTRFNYFSLYRTFYAINAHPDLRMDGDIVVSRDDTQSPPRRYGNLDLFVKDELPIHGIVSVANSGTESTGDWRPSLTLQHLNLTRHDDVMTLNLGPISDDVKSLLSFGLNYYVPYTWKKGGGVTVYGGYSELDAQEVVKDIAVKGNGWFMGVQDMHRIRSTSDSVTSAGAGLTYRYIEDRLILSEEAGTDVALQKRPLTLVPLSLMLSHSSLASDALGGRNFFTLQWVAHVDGMGGSSEEEFEAARAGSDPNYNVLRLQVARLQPVFGRMGLSDDGRRRERKGEWLLFFRGDAQWASDILVPVEQKAIGGMDSVRGFPERVVLGDQGITGTLELRTPLFTGSHLSRWSHRNAKTPKQSATPSEGIQFVTFVDGGAVWSNDDSEDSFTMASAGAGLRLMLGETAQIRFDWGVPIAGRSKVDEASQEDVSSSGRFHLSAQVQF